MLVIYTKTHVSYLYPNRLCEIYPNETTLSRWEVIIRQYKLFITICVLWRKNRIIDTYSMYLHVFSDRNSNIILLNTLYFSVFLNIVFVETISILVFYHYYPFSQSRLTNFLIEKSKIDNVCILKQLTICFSNIGEKCHHLYVYVKNSYSKRICRLLIWALWTFKCGKKITELHVPS